MKTNYILLIALFVIALTTPPFASGYELPLRGNDLASGERYRTFVHTAGIQAEGKDIGVLRYVSDSSWAGLKSDGANIKVLDNWLVYGKPFYAMASGTVIGCWRNAPENTPGSYHADYDKGGIAGGGNHLWILQDDGVIALYAHAKTGSIPSSICGKPNALMVDRSKAGPGPNIAKDAVVVNGAKIKTGQFLGQIGNSGASEGGPHLHVHMEKDGKPVEMKFASGLTTSFTGGKASLNGPWAGLNGKIMPESLILFWPSRTLGNYTFNGMASDEFQRLAEHMYDSGEMANLVTCQSNGASYNSTWVPAKGVWAMHHDMSAAVAAEKHAYYTHQGYKRTSTYTCGSTSVAVWRKS
ncbi:MAG: M23 family metallopeptidase [Pyrinomonadaceae bacterium]